MQSRKDFSAAVARKRRFQHWERTGRKPVARVLTTNTPAQIFEKVLGQRPTDNVQAKEIPSGILLAASRNDISLSRGKQSIGFTHRDKKRNKLGIRRERIAFAADSSQGIFHEPTHVLFPPDFRASSKILKSFSSRDNLTLLEKHILLDEIRKKFHGEFASYASQTDLEGIGTGLIFDLRRFGEAFETKVNWNRFYYKEFKPIFEAYAKCRSKNVPPEILSKIIAVTPWENLAKTLDSLFWDVKQIKRE